MPNVLLFDCPEDLVRSFADDDRWSVGIAVHASAEKRALGQQVSALPDPRHWNLIIDDCDKENPMVSAAVYSLPIYVVTDEYLQECGRAHGLRMCGRSQHLPHSTSATTPEGHKNLEFNATSDPRSLHLLDFLETFQEDFARYALHFSYVSMRRPFREGPDEFQALFRDSYRYPVVGLFEEEPDWLIAIEVPDLQRRVAALHHLAYRVAPKLWPDIYSDSFFPRRVAALMERKNAVIDERRKLEMELEEQIQQELAFYAPFVNLLHIGDEALKLLVKRVLEDVFHFDVRDVDAELQANEPKRFDLMVTMNDKRAFVEVRGSGTRNARIAPDIDRMETNVERGGDKFGRPDVKVLVFNGMYLRSADEREQNPPFSEDVVREASAQSITLISTAQLLEAIEKYRNEEVSIGALVAALSRPGVFEMP